MFRRRRQVVNAVYAYEQRGAASVWALSCDKCGASLKRYQNYCPDCGGKIRKEENDEVSKRS